MSDTPKRRYRRRNLSDKEVQAEFDKWLARTANRGVDPDFTRWLCANEQGFTSVEGVALVYERLEYKQRYQIIKACLAAAEKTVPARGSHGCQIYSYHSMFAAFSLRLALNLTYRDLILHYQNQFPDRYATFGNLIQLPARMAYWRFENNLTSETWKTYLRHLSSINSGLSLLLESRYVIGET